jgi:SAM-dependent methyltransferase
MTLVDPNSSIATADATPEPARALSGKGYRYGEDFYRYIEAGSIRSASVVVPLVLRELSPVSVLDVGCGAGAWLSEYRNCGITDYFGVDGAYVQQSSLLISAGHFQSQDVAQAFDLGRRFDLVQCLEVGEHLPAVSSDTLIGNLVRHGDKVLFSAATPGQGGENHINEQTHEFWRLLFAKHGYKPFDMVRPVIRGVAAVASWYRRNIVLYVAEAAVPALPPAVKRSGITDDRRIPGMTSFAYRVQARALSFLPDWCVSKMALAKHNIVFACRSLRGS